MTKPLLSLCISLLYTFCLAQSAAHYAILIQAEVQESPPAISLNWHKPGTATQYFVYRKAPTETSWGTPYDTVISNTFTDTNVNIGTAYEYYIRSESSPVGIGYVLSGIQLSHPVWQGKLVLVVDTTHTQVLNTKLKRFKNDLRAEGWELKTINIDRNDEVPFVGSLIQQVYNQDTANTKALVLFGHVPVPYSGNLNPDAHANHLGAWPTDAYYADMDGNWTDVSVNSTGAAQSRNRNVPGDGKFDQSIIPGELELMVGRIDLSDLGAFSKTEAELLADYLDKDHAFRTAQFVPNARALIDDNFGAFSGEAFAVNGWRNFPVMVGRDSTLGKDYQSTLSTDSYLWAYGCGAGSYTSVSGVVNTSKFANDSMLSVFNLLFGSYFGDWDSPNNVLRAPLASGTGLVSIWAGRPHYALHHMGLGGTVGASVFLNQNNTGIYSNNGYTKFIHMGMMGDPTLRAFNMQPPTNLIANTSPHEVNLSWTATPDQNLGYYIYRRQLGVDTFELQTPIPLQLTSYTDSCLSDGTYEYYVHARQLKTTHSGSYYLNSPGIYDTVTAIPVKAVALFDTTTNGSTVQFINQSLDGVSYRWAFGDMATDTAANTVHTYLASGNYLVWLYTTDACGYTDSISKLISITLPSDTVDTISGLLSYPSGVDLHVFPNPNKGRFELSLPADLTQDNTYLKVYSAAGGLVMETPVIGTRVLVELPETAPSGGMYILQLITTNKQYCTKVLVER